METAMLGIAGMLIGALIGGLVTLWFTYNGFSYPGMDEMAANFNLQDRFYPKATILTLFLGPAVVFVGSILSSLYPALRLHRLHPVEAMRAP
jgi:ABC-type lipoprotein release transport system permease subunit